MSITITISIPLDVVILLDVDLDWGLEIAIINSKITNTLIIFNKGLSLVKSEFLAFKYDKEECVSDAWVYFPNLYQKNNIAHGWS